MSKQQVWFITGASRGFGKALAEEALSRGDIVFGTGRNALKSDDDTFKGFTMLQLDVCASQEEINKVAQEVIKVHGRIDVVVNNAGYGLLSAIEFASEKDFRDQFDTNFFGPWKVIKAFLPSLREQKSGHIINISSVAGMAPGAGSGIYASSKFALEGLSESLLAEVAQYNIKVTIVEPGSFRTEFLGKDSGLEENSGNSSSVSRRTVTTIRSVNRVSHV
eukprot:TRINITY_DN7620_c0_g1_i2.p1 TRINITY_DN7620_c0_g1~~TRINITY_DN7620_c0_g1_i2.p1  ORF type:complete len:220 (-),score=50.04 TRINITY_DN7620_c0_g1_i2:53-712(-)